MADNVQSDAGEPREESSTGFLLSVDPLQDVVSYKLTADDEDEDAVDDSDGDAGDGDGSDADDSDSDDGETLVVVDATSDSDDSGDDAGDDSDGDASDDD